MIPLGGNSTAVRRRASVKFLDALLGFTNGPLAADVSTLGWESLPDASGLGAATEAPRAVVIAANLHAGSWLSTIGMS